MKRQAIAGLVLVGLALGVWLLWPRGDLASSTSSTLLAVASTTSTTASLRVTTTIDETTTTTSHVVETVEEAEAILRELWFGWFEGIYNQDEDRIREVVATEVFLDDAVSAFDTDLLKVSPVRTAIAFASIEILRADKDCLALWSESDLSGLLGDESIRSGVDVLRWSDNKWKMATAWSHRDDLWEADCGAQLQPLP